MIKGGKHHEQSYLRAPCSPPARGRPLPLPRRFAAPPSQSQDASSDEDDDEVGDDIDCYDDAKDLDE